MKKGPDALVVLESLIRWRRDVRVFKPLPISEALLDTLFTLADASPSVGLSQPWRVLRVDSKKSRQLVQANFEEKNRAALSGFKGERQKQYASLKLAGFDCAPVHLAVFCEQAPRQGHGLGRATMPETLIYSCVCMIQTLWLAAQAAGVGLGWVSILNPRTLCRDLASSPDWKFIGYLLLGWPEEKQQTPALERAGWEARSPFASRWQTR